MGHLRIVFVDNDKGNPPGKLADAELHFDEGAGPLTGLKLIGFAVWESRTGGRLNVTFPARTYTVNGERRSFALLRPTSELDQALSLRSAILDAWALHVNARTARDRDDVPSVQTPAMVAAYAAMPPATVEAPIVAGTGIPRFGFDPSTGKAIHDASPAPRAPLAWTPKPISTLPAAGSGAAGFDF